LDVAAVKMILRDHFEGELIEPRYGPGDGLFASICMHAMTGTDSKTAASLIASFDGTLGVVCRHCFSTPCSSVYMPVYLTGYLPAVLQNAGEVYEPESLWWALERLSCAIEVDSARFLPLVRPALTSLENEFEQQAAAVEQEAAALTRAGNRRMADDLLNALMDSCAARLLQAANSAGADLADILRSDGGVYGVKADLLQSYCARTGITLI